MHTLHLRSQGARNCRQPHNTLSSPVYGLPRASRAPHSQAPGSTYRGRSVSCSAQPAGEKKEPADILAEDQGGQEFDTNAEKDKGKYEADDESKDTADGEAAEVKDTAAEDQGGREFEPLPVKRILVDN